MSTETLNLNIQDVKVVGKIITTKQRKDVNHVSESTNTTQ